MALTVYRIQAVLPSDTLETADACMNTFHFQSTTADTVAADVEACFDKVQAFYTAIDVHLSSEILDSTLMLTGYDLEDPEPRVPIAERGPIALTMTASGFPAEVALCLSYQGPRIAGVNQARRRGRIYIGPLAAASTQVDGSIRPNAGLITGLVTAGAALAGGDSTGGDVFWSVYSPTARAGGASVTASATIVTEGWVDNAFDTQRRRGPEATARTTYTGTFT